MEDYRINLDDVQALGLEKIPTDKADERMKQIITQEQKEIPMEQENKLGVEHLAKVIAFFVSAGNAVKAAKENDGKLSVGDIAIFVPLAIQLATTFDALNEAAAEAKDFLSEEDKAKIALELAKINFVDPKVDEIIVDGSKIAMDLKNFVYKYFVK